MEELAECSSDLESQSKCAELSPRGYQLEFVSKAREGNIIVCLETGCGKTLIAAMLLKELSCKFSFSTPSIAVFLVPTVMLVQQQARAIEESTDLKVGQYNGQNDNMRWDLEKWNYDVYNLEVLVMTPQILLNILQHAMLRIEVIKVLVFDECHHCQKNHPYALIMEEFYFKMETCKRPRILGMTASPVIRKGKSELQCTQDIHSLERMLDAKIVTVKDRSELDLIVPRPTIQIKEYDRVYHSLDRLKSVMKLINTLKEKQAACHSQGICYTDHKGSNGRKNELEGLGRICRDLEYCIYDLGLWFARHAALHGHVLKDSKENNDSTPEEEKDLFVRELYDSLDQNILQGGYGVELGVDNLRPDLVSNKVASLVDVLANFRHSQLKCIVFVERVVAAKVLANFLSKVLPPLRCDYIVGNHLKVGGSSRNRMPKTLSNFRSGLIDLLVATNVAEEGIDIQDCCLIVQFDMPKTLRSFIQSRGRARVRSSHYVILKDRKNISEDESLNTLIDSEKFVVEKILQGHDLLTNSKAREEGDVYKVKSTGAIVTSHSSVQLLHHYCSKLPSDQFYHPQPTFVYVQEQYGVKCCLTLPSNACIRVVEGEYCESEVAAKRAACLKACKILHSKGALTDHLLPPTSTFDGPATTCLNARKDKEATEELQEPLIPTVWSCGPSIKSDLICLHAYKIAFDAVGGDREYSNFALLLMSPLPKEAADLSETFELRRRRAVSCKLELLKEVSLNPVQVAQAEQFQSTLFSILLDRKLEHSQIKDKFVADGAWYLLLPLKRDQQFGISQDPKIDWDRITKLKSFGDSNNMENMAKSAFLKADGTALQFSNGVQIVENVPGLLVKTIYGKHMYCIIDIFKDLHAESPFPDDRYKNYVEYFRSMYKHELVHRRQHLLKARPLRDAHNFLLSRSSQEGASDLSSDRSGEDVTEHFLEARKPTEEPEKSIVELPAEIYSIEYFGFYDDLINAAVILPSLMHRIESILVATQFHTFLGSQFPEGSLVSVEKVREALTTQKCLDSSSLERLELLGDSFLKYAISCNLFAVHDEADEGFLSVRRMEKVCNSTLFQLGKNIGLMGYIRDSFFDPKHWVSPCYPSKFLCDETKARDLHGESSKEYEGKLFVTCNKRHRWMQRKTVADSTEALIGAYLEDGGEHAALAFMRFIGMEVGVNTLQVDRVKSLSQSSLSLIKRIDVKTIERLLSYSFRHKEILIEAFTHASCTNHLGKCYQRLEFLGDSVLDFLITQHLYREFKDSNPGELTDLRSTIVSNESFARIVIKWKLYSYLIEDSEELSRCIKKFISYSSQHGIPGEWDGDKCPKVLGDILESLSGAIFVDGGFDLRLVWKVLAPILQPLISAGNIQFHPVRELLELCQQNRFAFEGSLSKGDKQIQFNFKIFVENEVVDGTATSKDKKSAKKHAALDALAKLKALGYEHSRFKALGSRKMSNLDLESIGSTSTTTLSSDFITLDTGNDTDIIQDGMVARKISENKLEQPLKVDEMKVPTEIQNLHVVSQRLSSEKTAISAIDYSVDNSSGCCDDICKGKEQKVLWLHANANHGHSLQQGLQLVGSSQSTLVNASRLDAQVAVWAQSRDDNIKYDEPGGGAEQSTKKASENSVHMPMLDEGCGPGITKEFDSLHLSPLDTAASATQVAARGRPRTDLYEACAGRKWKDPSFTCSSEDGPPHDRCFTYQVVLQLPRKGQVECTGDPRRTRKAAMDSAAEELLKWLAYSGYL